MLIQVYFGNIKIFGLQFFMALTVLGINLICPIILPVFQTQIQL